MSLTRRHFSVYLAGVVALAGLSPTFAIAQDKPEVIRLASFGNAAGKPYGSGAIGLLRAKEWLEKEFAADNIRIEWQFPRGTGPAINEAIANGQLDFAAYGGLPNIVGRGAGLQTKVVASSGVNPVYLAAGKAAGIASLADLKGKKVAIARGTIHELSFNRFLTLANLTESDVQIFDLQTADQISAITSGDIDAFVGSSTSVVPLVDKGIVSVVHTTKGTPSPGTSFGSFVVTDAFAQAYPEITQRVVTAFVKASHYVSQEENRAELFDVWALTGAPKTSFEKDFEGELLADRQSPLLDDFYRTNVEIGVKFAVDHKLIRKPFDINEWVDDRYLKTALKELGYENVWTPRDAQGNKVQF